MIKLRLILLVFVGVLHCKFNCSHAQVDFNRDIRPILSNKCFACHGPDDQTREAGLRLDHFEGATEDLGDYQALAPGNPDESELIVRVSSDDDDEVMPPAGQGKRLTDREIKLLRQWIKEGGKYSLHWSYAKPIRPELPSLEDQAFAKWAKNEIDTLVYRQMRRHQLNPESEADRVTLIRRLSIDLTGLPPSLEEVEAFVKDDSPQAYEKLVDHLLAKPAFGERWATVWLDLARYADSAGYAEDRKRTIWAFRDYVIRALNQNKPFDQFTIEQIAGDLLKNPTVDQMIATAFHRNTLTNSEGGTSDEEFRNAAVVDRVNTTMAVWMGTTMACAQCHNHKYDPISQKEYFQFFAFFNSTADNDRPNESPVMEVFDPEKLERRKKLIAQIEIIQKTLSSSPMTNAELERLAAALKPVESVKGRYVKVEILNRDGILSLAEVQVFSGGKNIAPEGKATQSSVDYAGPAKLAIDGNTNGDFTRKSVTHTRNEKTPWWQVDLGKTVPVDQISVWNRTGPGMTVRLNDCRVSIMDENKQVVWQRDFPKALPNERRIAIANPPAHIMDIAKTPAAKRSPEQQSTLARFLWENSAGYRKLQAELNRLKSERDSIKAMTTVPVIRELPKPRPTKIQIRGNYQDTGEAVDAATPKIFHELDGKPDRMKLAKWLVSRDNPLTARVVANRFWEQLFGLGIVSTSEEFGNQGDLPSHPELLDYLAVELMDSGWDQKALIKTIVMSATYRQQSTASIDKRKRDPNNRFLSRGPRVRLSAEMIRDQALFVSGLLNQKMYGPPAQPPQPKFGLKAAFSGSVDWKDSVGPERYRRGLYTEWRRSAPYPSMTTFDKSNLEVCEVKRARTNTPLQALVTLNDPVFVEAAQALARRVLREKPGASDAELAEHAFRLCLIRRPSEKEKRRIVQLYLETLEHFKQDPASARNLALDPLNPVDDKTDFAKLAAWTTVANVLLNLDEIFQKP